MSLLALVLLPACEAPWVDPSDCAIFADCAPRIPEGMACGLTNISVGDVGGACLADGQAYVPSEIQEESGNIPCPSGYVPTQIEDHEGYGWWTCAKDRSIETLLLRDVRQLPVGAMCGLSTLNSKTDQSCHGYKPTQMECPPGFRIRWLVDEGYDDIDESAYDCVGIQSGGDEADGLATQVFDILVYCEVAPEYGCTTDCPEQTLGAGLICGLHNRSWIEACGVEQGGVRIDAEMELLEGAGYNHDIRSMSDMERQLRERCYNNAELMEGLDALARAGAIGPDEELPQCAGVPITNSGTCPEGMTLTCTSDFLYEQYADPEHCFFVPGCHVNTQGLCWCGPEGGASPYVASTSYDLFPTCEPNL